MPEFTLKFGILEAAREALHAAPFKAFKLRLHDGTRLSVNNSDVLWVSKGGTIVFDDAKTLRILNPAMVTSIEQKSPHR
jgi:hypothetical protein